MPSLNEIIGNPQLNGVYRIGADVPEMPGLLRLDARALPDREALLRGLGQVLDFPDYYGANWDALEECLFDLSWWQGPICFCLLSSDALPPEDIATLADIWGEAAWEWLKVGRVCTLLLADAAHDGAPQRLEN